MSAAVTASNAATAANGVSPSSAASSSAVATATANSAAKPAVQPSEVGWLFVTQYYTFLNQNPARLHCFFTKKSTMVHGIEQEESSPCFGQQQIHDKITSLNYQDAKVFVSNVDSQSSASGGILVQVLGELSNNGAAWRKFAQTFFLAEQPNGYYVLNDIFRYLKDDDEIEAEAEAVDEALQEEIDEADKNGVEVAHTIQINNIGNANAVPHLPAPTSSPAASKAIEAADTKPAATEQQPATKLDAPSAADNAVATSTAAEPTNADADQVGTDKKLTAVDNHQAPVPPKGAKDAADAAKTETAPAAAASAPNAAASTPAAAAAAAAAPTPAPAQPAGPPKPKTWATLAASDATRWGSNVSAEAKGVSSSRPAAATTSTAAKPAAAAAAASAPKPAAATSNGASSSPSVYIKNVVADQVTEAALRQALEAFGTVKDVQIIGSRSCAFAEFTSVDGARKAAAKASVAVGKNGWNVTIEERRKPSAGGAGGAGAAGGARGAGGAPRNGAAGGSRTGAARGGNAAVRAGRGGAGRAGAN